MTDVPKNFRKAIPDWGRKERLQALKEIQAQIETARSSHQALEAHLEGQPHCYRDFWADVLAKREHDVAELEAIKHQFPEAEIDEEELK